MNKTSIILGLIALTMTSIAGGLWFTRPSDSGTRITILEGQLREKDALIARLNKQISSANMPHVAGAGAGSGSSIAGNGVAGATGMASPNGFQKGGLSSPGSSVPQAGGAPAAGSAPGTTVKSDKRLAEAEARYADLINQFGLQPDEKEAFKSLAAKRDDIRKQAFSKLSDPSLTPAQRQAVLTDAKAQMGQVDDSVRQFLNNDTDYNTFQKWETQNIERGQIDDARPIFEKNGVALDPAQETWLTDQLWTLRNDTKGLGDPYSADTLAGRRIDQPYIAAELAKFDNDTTVLLQNARSKMTQPQIAATQAMRYQQRVRLEAQLWNMARTTGQQ